MQEQQITKVGLSQQEAERLGLNEDNGLPWVNANIEQLLVDNEVNEIADAVSRAFAGRNPELIANCLVRIHFDTDSVAAEVLEVGR